MTMIIRMIIAPDIVPARISRRLLSLSVNTRQHTIHYYQHGTIRGATMAEKLRGTKVWVPTPGHLRPAPNQRPGWVLGAGGVSGYNRPPLENFKNSYAKSCTLVTTMFIIEYYGQEVGDQSPNLKVGRPVSPGTYDCYAYGHNPPFGFESIRQLSKFLIRS